MKKISVVVKINPRNDGTCSQLCYFYTHGLDENSCDVYDCCISGEEVGKKPTKCPYSDYPEVKE